MKNDLLSVKSNTLPKKNNLLSMKKEKELGMSIIELMIAIAISAFLVLGLSQLFINARQGLRVINNITEMNDNARIALYRMEQVISEAGFQTKPKAATANYIGCFRRPAASNPYTVNTSEPSIPPNLFNTSSWTINFSTNSLTSGIFTFAGLTGPIIEAVPNRYSLDNYSKYALVECYPNNKLYIGAYRASVYLPVTELVDAVYNAQPFPKERNILDGYISGITNRNGSDELIIRVMGRDSSTGAPPIYDCNGVIIPAGSIKTMQFYVDSTTNELLCRRDQETRGVVILENVTLMKVQYGEDLDGDGVPNHYAPYDSLNSLTLPIPESFFVGSYFMKDAPGNSTQGKVYTQEDARTVCETAKSTLVMITQIENKAKWQQAGWVLYNSLIRATPPSYMSTEYPTGNGPSGDTNETKAGVICYGLKPKINLTDPSDYVIMQKIDPFSFAGTQDRWYASGSFIVNVRIALLVHSKDPILSVRDKNQYRLLYLTQYSREGFSDPDRFRFRKVYLSNIRLKNVIPNP